MIANRSISRALLAALLTALVSSTAAMAPAQTDAPAPSATPQLTRAPQLKAFVEAPFPESERARGADAAVILELLISEQGKVTDARVAESAGEAFDSAALEAARQFEFEPAEIDGKPAPIKIRYRYEFVFEPPPPALSVLRGEVRRRGSGEPLGGVTVRLDTGQEARSDDQGRFEIRDVAPGAHTLLLSGPELSAIQTEEHLEAGKEHSVLYEIEPVPLALPGEEAESGDDLEIEVRAPKLTREAVATRVSAESARRVAGTQGDVLKIVENMPGVARAAAGSGDVVVWGAAPADTRVYVDGVRVPALYHFGGLRSVVHADLVDSVELTPGAYGAAYGRGLGGLVTVATREPNAERLRPSATLDLLDASAAVHGRVSERVGLSGAFRRSHLHEVLSGAVQQDVAEYFPIPKYWDGSLRLRYAIGPSEWVELGGMIAGDEITRSIDSTDPSTRRSETRRIGFDRVHFRYQLNGGDGTRVVVVPWLGRDRSRLSGLFGTTPVELDVESSLYGLRASWLGSLGETTTLQLGADLELVQSRLSRRGSVSAPPREGDARVFGQPPADQVNTDTWRASTGSAAPFLELDVALFGELLHVVPGVRFEPFFSAVNRRRPAEGSAPDVGAFSAELSVQPRLSVRVAPVAGLLVKLAYGRYGQPPLGEDLSSVFGNPLLGTARADHYLIGAQAELGASFDVEITGFYASSSELAVRNPLPSPRVAETLLNLGEGRAYGAQLLLRRELADGFFGWLAYTIQRSERRGGPDVEYRPFDYDQTHVLTALASQDLGAGFEAGVRFRAATGYPRTPVAGAYYDARRDLYEPILGDKNGARLPFFWQADVRIAKRFDLGSSALEAYLDVQNVTNRDNAEEVSYAADYGEARFIRGLPILPVLGAAWKF